MQISLFSEIRSSNHASDQENLPWLRGTTAFWGFRQVYELKYQYIGTVYLQEVRETQLQVGDSSSGWSSVIKGLRFKSTLFLSSIISLNSVKVIETAIKFFSTYHQVSRAVLLALNDLQKGFDAIESLEPKSKIIAFILIAKALSMRSEKTVDAENAQQRAIQELKSFLLNKNAISVADRDLIEFLLNADGDLTLVKQAYANNFDFSIQRGVLSVQALFSEAWKLCPQEFAEYLVEESKKKEKMDSLYEYTTYDY